MTHYYEPGAPYFYLCVQNKCYLFTSCEQGCLLLHPKKIQVFCVGVDDLYNIINGKVNKLHACKTISA